MVSWEIVCSSTKVVHYNKNIFISESDELIWSDKASNTKTVVVYNTKLYAFKWITFDKHNSLSFIKALFEFESYIKF